MERRRGSSTAAMVARALSVRGSGLGCRVGFGGSTLAVMVLVVLAPGEAAAQELEPRTYANTPVDLNFLAVVYGHSSGNILLDTALPIEDLEADLDLAALRYVRTFRMFGRAAKVDVSVPYSWGTWRGLLEGEAASTSRTGFGDPRFRLTVNFIGAPALEAAEFAAYRQRTIVGASLQVIAPMGQYDPSKLINLGSNRWTLRVEIGVSRRVRNWTFEGAIAGWFFTDNDDFFGGARLKQDPVVSLQAHVLYHFKPGLWLGFDIGIASGGRTTVDGEFSSELEENSRAGVTLVVPLGRRDGLSFTFARGVTTRVGADFDTLAVGYQHMWGGGPGH